MRAQVDLEVPRATWLRSTDMDVEIGGALSVWYSRALGDLVMVGDLQALRGSYMVLGRRFEVSGGTVRFLGTPGINPTLAVEDLLGTPNLTSSQKVQLDRRGNRDGVFNLGDLLALLHRSGLLGDGAKFDAWRAPRQGMNR